MHNYNYQSQDPLHGNMKVLAELVTNVYSSTQSYYTDWRNFNICNYCIAQNFGGGNIRRIPINLPKFYSAE